MTEDRTQRLSGYLDGELSEQELAELERDLAADPALAGLLEELRAVRETAAALPALPPERDLWPGIESRIASGAEVVELAPRRTGRRRAVTFTWPQLAAAALGALIVGGGATWAAMQAGIGAARPPVVAGASAPGEDVVRPVAVAAQTPLAYRLAVQDLERRLAEERDRLDPRTVKVLEQSLATIDSAIAKATEALERDPSNVYLNRHLADARARKLQLLRQATVLAPRT